MERVEAVLSVPNGALTGKSCWPVLDQARRVGGTQRGPAQVGAPVPGVRAAFPEEEEMERRGCGDQCTVTKAAELPL